jgi:dethiobiotin synthetase
VTPQYGAFLLGTDTGAGKTALATALLVLARRYGLRPLPFKPVETGCAPLPQDATRLRAAAARDDVPLSAICPFAFASPVAPALAAAQAGVALTLSALLAAPIAPADFLLIESAGGLLTPYAPGLTGADLAAASALPVVLAARNALGTINHTALALAELARRSLPVAALILSETSAEATPDRPHNAELIAALTGTHALATLPHIPGADPEQLADALAAQVPPEQLFERLRLR